LNRLQRALEGIYLERVREETDPDAGRKGIAHTFTWRKLIADCVNYYAQHDPDRVRAIGSQVHRYYRVARWMRLNNELLRQHPSRGATWVTSARMAVIGIAGFPIAFYGAVNNYLPYRLAKLAGLRNPSYRDHGDKTKISIYSLLAGAVAFLVFYPVQGFLVWFFFDRPAGIIYLLSLPPSGFFALRYSERLKVYRRDLFYAWLHMKHRRLISLLKTRRDEVLATLDAVRIRYLREAGERREEDRDTTRAPGPNRHIPPGEG
jgi:glycerol-3-phosphate O-acyltransferase/dihydroxyacetone phosphate acyltransferase